MPRPRAYRSSKGVDMAAELSPSHLIIGIAVAFVFGIVCFVVGYVVAINDRPLQPEDTVAANTPPASTTPTPPPAPEKDASGTTPQRPDTGVQRPPVTPPQLAPLPSSGEGPTRVVKTPVKLPETAGQAGKEEDAQHVTATTLPPPGPGGTAPIKPPADKEAAKPAADTPPAPKKPAATPSTPPKPATDPAPEAPSATKSSWGIQVAFFDGDDRKQQAETVRKRLTTTSDHKATVVVSNADKEYRVVIPGFPTRDAAQAACDELRGKTGFSDAWVKRLP